MAGLTKLTAAYDYAARAHWEVRQIRKDSAKTPYINHPIGVAHLLSAAGETDVDVLCAAVLHDVVEDTAKTHEDIVLVFGERIAEFVREVTDDKSLPKDERKRLQIVHAAHASREAQAIKMADTLYNLTDLLRESPGWPPQRVLGYFVWKSFVCRPIYTANVSLAISLEQVFAQSIPADTDYEQVLEEYMQDMAKIKFDTCS